MLKYRSTATNPLGLTFVIFFWGNGTTAEAQARLNEVVARDPTHIKNGPWVASHVMREA